MKTTTIKRMPILALTALSIAGSGGVFASTVDFNTNPAPTVLASGTIVSGDYSFAAGSVLGVLMLDSVSGVFNGTKSLVFLNSTSLTITRSDAGLFNLGTLDVGFTSGALAPSELLKITGHSGSGDVSITAALSKTSFSTVSTAGFNNLTSVTLSVLGDTSSPGYVAIDNLAVTAVPEPETYAMLLAGLGLIPLAARRRRGA